MFIFKKKSQLNFSWFKNLRQSLLSIHWYVSKIDRKRSSTLHTFGLHLAPRDRRHLRRYGISSTALCSQALLSDFLRPVISSAHFSPHSQKAHRLRFSSKMPIPSSFKDSVIFVKVGGTWLWILRFFQKPWCWSLWCIQKNKNMSPLFVKSLLWTSDVAFQDTIVW